MSPLHDRPDWDGSDWEQYDQWDQSCSTAGRTPPANNSAYSLYARPDEDWTKVADLAERRRMQNRIAQRRYRASQKAHMEDLEAQVKSTSSQDLIPKKNIKKSPKSKPKKRQQANTPPRMNPTPPMEPAELPFGFEDSQRPFGQRPFGQSMRMNHTFPPLGQSPFAPQSSAFVSQLSSFAPQPYQTITTTDSYPAYPIAVSTIPQMSHFNDAYASDHGNTLAGSYYAHNGTHSTNLYDEAPIYSPQSSYAHSLNSNSEGGYGDEHSPLTPPLFDSYHRDT